MDLRKELESTLRPSGIETWFSKALNLVERVVPETVAPMYDDVSWNEVEKTADRVFKAVKGERSEVSVTALLCVLAFAAAGVVNKWNADAVEQDS